MNEKLREEIERSFVENDCRVAECTGLSYSTFERIAEHFYNFALADVRREIVGRKGVNEHLGRKGHIEEDLLILDFIDEQSK